MLKQIFKKALPLLLGLACLGPFLFGPNTASASNPSTINFQGKVVNSNGTNVSDGTYSFVFRIYNTSSPTPTTACTSDSACLWQETQASVQVTSGVFQVELGSSCALTSSSCNNSTGGPINFASNSSLYLTMQFNGDTSGTHGGFMWPVIHITSVPFALQADNASTLGGLSNTNFVQLAQGLQSDGSTTNASIAINKTGSTANILTLQKSSANVLLLDNNGLLTLQPAAAFTGTGTQSALTQTITTNQTGGTVNGYNQSITVSNASGNTNTNGFNILITDNTSLANNTNGLKVTLTGSNTSTNQVGVDVSVNAGYGIRAISSGITGPNCGPVSGSSIGVCGGSSYSGGAGIVGYSSGASGGATPSNSSAGVGSYGTNASSGTAGKTYTGVSGYANQTAAAAYTSVGVYGQGNGGAGATQYGGYFALGTGGATAGAALFATNSTVAANILDLQDNTTSVFTVGDGGLITLQPAANLTAGQTEVAQTLTNASSTGGTVNGYSQTITVSNTTSASTTNGFNISLTDNTSLGNRNNGISITLQGSNASQQQVGVDTSVNTGIGIRGISSGAAGGSSLNCGQSGATNLSAGVCGVSTIGSAANGTGVIGYSTSSAGNSVPSSPDTTTSAGVLGDNNSSGSAGKVYIGTIGVQNANNAAAYTSIGVLGYSNGGSGATQYGGYFELGANGATLGSALYATNKNVAANILDLQDNTTSVFTVGDGGLITLQPAANLTAGQTEVAQTLTNASSTGGTVNGYSQTITVSNTSSASTTNGFNISLTDSTAGSLVNINTGIKITLSGTNASQRQIGIDSTVNKGLALRGSSSGRGGSVTCGTSSGNYSVGICGASTDATDAESIGVWGYSQGGTTSSFGSTDKTGSGVTGQNDSTGVAGDFYAGVKGVTSTANSAAYTSAGIVGRGDAGTGATIYGGYFTLGTTGATAGSALYASNSTVAANILDLQDNTTSVFTVGDGGLITLQPAANLTAGQTEVAQTLTNASSTGGTVNGYSQTITVSNTSSASTTNGFNISLSDATTLANTNTGINLSINDSSASGAKTDTGLKINIDNSNVSPNTSLLQYGIDVSLAHGVNGSIGIRAIESSANLGATGATCADNTSAFHVAICADQSGLASNSGTGLYARTNGDNTGLTTSSGTGVYGVNTSSRNTAGRYYIGIQGVSKPTGAAAYTSIGVFGKAGVSTASSAATTYGGYFQLDSSSTATSGAALYATNSSVAANILDLQDNTTSVFTVGDGGLITSSTNSSSGLVVKNSSSSKAVLTVDTSANKLVLGTANTGGIDGTLVFNTSAGANSVGFALQANPVSSYTLLLPSTGPSTSQCLQTDSTTANQLKFASCSTGGGYTTVQDEGSNLTARSTINFIGNSVACADNSGSSRTDCTIAPTLQNAYDNSGSPATITTSSSAKNFVLASGTGFNSAGVFQVQNDIGSNALGVDTTPLNTLLVNSNFENSSTTNWVYSGAVGGSAAKSTSQAYLGAASLAVTSGTTATANDGVKYVVGTTLSNSTSYTLSFYAISPGSTMSNLTVVYTPDGGTTNFTCMSGQSVLTTAWTRYSCSFNSTQSAVNPNASAFFIIKNGDTTTRTFNIDAVQLEFNNVGSPSPYKETGINLQGTVTSNTIFSGMLSLQPASSLVAGQSEVQQTLSSTATSGTVNGYNQSITVSNGSGTTTTNGFNISLTDNTALGNTNQGITVSLAGSNGNQKQIGISSSVNHGFGVQANSTGTDGTSSLSCGTLSGAISVGTCSTASGSGGVGVYGVSSTSINSSAFNEGAGVVGENNAASPGASKFLSGVRGVTTISGTDSAYTTYGVYGSAKGTSSATNYGGYFTLQSGSSTLGSALYASNNSVAANILDLQDNTTSVFTVGDGGLITLQPAANLTAGQTEVAQTLTNASSTGGTVNGYSQTITVNNTTSASTTNGFNISLTDNTSLGNTNVGINVTLAGTNANQQQFAIKAITNGGVGISGSSSGAKGTVSCGSSGGALSIGVCGSSAATAVATGVFGEVTGATTDSLPTLSGSAGVLGKASEGGTASSTYVGVKGIANQTASAAFTSVGVYGQARGGSGASVYGGYFGLSSSSSASLGAALYATNSTVAANILDLQDNTTSVFTVGDNGLISLQPAAALTGTGTQSNVSQTLTNNQTGGTVNGYNQSITVSNASGTTTTNGFNISLTDNTALGNTNNGIKISLNGSNTSQSQLGIDVTAANGFGIRAVSSGGSGGIINCGGSGFSGVSVGICADSTNSTGSIGAVARSSSTGSTVASSQGSGVYGVNTSNSSAGNFVKGLNGVTTGAGTAGTAIGVYGQGNQGAGATVYGGYFTLGTGGATAGSALYASNSTVAANILDLQDNTTDVMVVGDSGVTTFQNSTNSANAFQIKNQGGSSVFNVDNTKANANNLIANSSFESALSNWSALLGGAASQDATQFYEQTHSLKIVTNTNASGGGASYSTGTSFLSSNTTYTLSAYVKTDSTLFVNTFEMGRADNGSYTNSATNGCLTAQTLPANGGWQRFTCTFTTGTVSGSPFIYFKVTDNVNRNLYVDDVLLQTDDATAGRNADSNYRNAALNLTGTIINSPLVLQNAANTTTAFQVQDSAGIQIFNVDTTDTNLISNPSFEVNSTGWAAQAGTTAIRRDTTQTYTGVASLRIATSATASSGARFSLNPVVTKASTQYTLSWYARLDSGSSAFTTMTALYSPDGTTGANASTCTPASGTVVSTGWGRYSCTFTATATVPTTSSFVQIIQGAADTTAHTWYIDAVQLEQAGSASAYGAGAISFNGVINTPTILKNIADSVTAFQIQNSSGSSLITADTMNGQVLLGNAASLNGLLVFNNATNSNTISLTTQSGASAPSSSITFSLPNAYPSASNFCIVSTNLGFLSFSACGASSTASISLVPEFIGAVMTADGANNSGTMTSDFCGNDGAGSFPDLNTGVCNTSGDFHNYYNWTSNGANDYDIFVRWRVPTDFSSFSTVQFNSKKSATGDDVKLTIYTNSGAVCGTATSMTNTASAWQTTSYTISGCSPAAGDTLIFDVHMAVAANGNTCQMGEIPITYNRN